MLTNIDTELLSEVVKLLELFRKATLCFEAKSRATIYYVALYRIKLEKHLAPKINDIPEIVEMKHFGLLYMREVWKLNDIHKKSVFFHPKLKNANILRDETERLIADIRREMVSVDINVDVEGDDDDDEIPVSLLKRRKLSPNELQERDNIVDEFFFADLNDKPNDELQNYLDSPVIIPHGGQIDLCQWWFQNRKLYPALYKLALKYLCVPASSATAESKFSFGGLVVSERRGSLNPVSVDDLLVLKSAFDNSDVME